MENVDLTIGAVRTHDILLDRFANSNPFDEVVEGRLFRLPLWWWYNFDDA
jgi:hypothetical protein